MKGIHSRIVDELSAGKDVCLATIVHRAGSTPRELGTRFLVRADGGIIGTIGGGRLEADVTRAAREALDAGVCRTVSYTLSGIDVAETDMLCGGDVSVFLEPLRARDRSAVELFRAAAADPGPGGALMVTSLIPGPALELTGRKLLLRRGLPPMGAVAADPDLAGTLTRRLNEILADNRPRRWTYTLSGGGLLECFLEPAVPGAVVYLFGGGHISLALADLLHRVEFRLVVADDRPEFANPERFPQAEAIWARDFEGVLDGIDLDRDAYVVIVTRGHQHDKTVLAQALAKNPGYVGMIGSRRKRDLIYRALAQEGFTQAQLDRVHSPIGLAIGARSPEEIAVSIVAELIAERAARQKDKPHASTLP